MLSVGLNLCIDHMILLIKKEKKIQLIVHCFALNLQSLSFRYFTGGFLIILIGVKMINGSVAHQTQAKASSSCISFVLSRYNKALIWPQTLGKFDFLFLLFPIMGRIWYCNMLTLMNPIYILYMYGDGQWSDRWPTWSFL